MPRKGQDLLLESWRELAMGFPGAHLVLVGPRADLNDPKLSEFRERVASLATDSGAADRIHFVGMTEDVEEYLRAADVFVLASSREGFPNSVLEAMATGLPVVVTPFIGRSPSMGRGEEHFLLCDRNPDALAACLARLLGDGELRARLGASALRLVREHFDVEKSLDRYVALYRELAAAVRR
jgi:glycosyltransferase involved in cell wall biosynthesis